jgi:hypothetical protein
MREETGPWWLGVRVVDAGDVNLPIRVEVVVFDRRLPLWILERFRDDMVAIR